MTGLAIAPVRRKTYCQVFHNLLSLLVSQVAMVNQDSCESVTNSLVHELGSHSRVYATTDSSQHLTRRTNQLSYPGNFLLDEVSHRPVLRSTTDAHCEVLEEFRALRRVYLRR